MTARVSRALSATTALTERYDSLQSARTGEIAAIAHTDDVLALVCEDVRKILADKIMSAVAVGDAGKAYVKANPGCDKSLVITTDVQAGDAARVARIFLLTVGEDKTDALAARPALARMRAAREIIGASRGKIDDVLSVDEVITKMTRGSKTPTRGQVWAAIADEVAAGEKILADSEGTEGDEDAAGSDEAPVTARDNSLTFADMLAAVADVLEGGHEVTDGDEADALARLLTVLEARKIAAA